MKNLLCLLLLPVCLLSNAQKGELKKSNLKFGDIKVSDFEPKVYEVDSNASAVILADIGDSKFEGNTNGDFSILFKHHKRIRIMNKNGFDAASVEIPIYISNNNEEKIENLEAVTYNLENGEVVATKLDKASIFKDKLSKNYVVKKFTFPNLKEGSIIEYKYTLNSPYYFNLQPWRFQSGLPRLWTEYSVSVPIIFDFVLLKQGYRPFDIEDATTSYEQYYISSRGESAMDRTTVSSINSAVVKQVWAMMNVPALKNESFTTTLENHIQKIEFQLRAIKIPNDRTIDIMGTWMKLADNLLKDEDFGGTLSKNNAFFDDAIKPAAATAPNAYDKAVKIYQFVRDNFTCTDYDSRYLSAPLKLINQAKSGNVADINLLLTAMLRSQGFKADPVILSTKEHGKAYELYPIMSRFNYVIARVKIDDTYYLLDAAHNKLGFGKLHEQAYNGYARVVDQMPELIDLSPDSLKEAKVTSIFMVNDDKGMSGSFNSTLGYYESYGVREKLNKTTKEEFFKDIKKAYSFDIDLSNASLDSLKLYEEPVMVKYDFSFTPEEDIIYLSPLFTEATKENPFKSVERQYPVEMPYSVNEVYILNMEIPKG